MRELLRAGLFVVIGLSAGMCWLGCDGNTESSDVTPATNAPGLQTLKSGDVVIPDGGVPVDAGSVVVPGAGKIVGVVSWAGDVLATAWFVKGGEADKLGQVTGASPLTSTVNGVAEDDGYTLRLSTPELDPIDASYTITYDPE